MSPSLGYLQSFRRNTITGKLVIAALTLMVPAFLLTYLLYSDVHDQVNFARAELAGVEYFEAIRQTASLSVDHRRLAAEYLTGMTRSRAALDRKQVEVEESLRRIEEVNRKLPAISSQKNLSKSIERLQSNWKAVVVQLERANDKNLERAFEPLQACDLYLSSVRDLMRSVADSSKLALDPEHTAHALMSSAQKVLSSADISGRIQWRAVLATSEKSASLPVDRQADLMKLYGELNVLKSEILVNYGQVIEERPELAESLSPKSKSWAQKQDQLLKLVEEDLVRADKINLTSQGVLTQGNEAIAAALELFDLGAPVLTGELSSRVSSLNRTLLIGYLVIVIGLASAGVVVYIITRGLNRQISAYLKLFAFVDQGRFDARVSKITNDELGDMTASFNQLLNTTEDLIKKQKADYEELQRSIMQLLEDVSGTAEGDLTREAVVSEDATGAIADSFNYMIEQLRKIIASVQNASYEVSSAAKDIYVSAENLADGSENQAEQIVNTTAAIDEMAVSIQQVSENAATSTSVAQQALQTAKQGNIAVRNTIEGMNRIREQAQETSKRVKRLGETSQEIGQIVQLIDDIADRTSILALNASIQAAAAGDAGRGFAVVAEEVERLAVRSTEATKKIASLVKAIQGETNEAVSAMEKSIQEVVNGSKVANQAGQSLQEIESVSNRLAEIIQSISQAAKQQARGSDALTKSMNEISQITRRNAEGTKKAASSVNGLSKLADELRSSVSTFKLPTNSLQEFNLQARRSAKNDRIGIR